jgi:hypothetical protein
LDITATQTAKLIDLNRNTVNQYYTLLRSLVIAPAIQERHQEQIANGVDIYTDGWRSYDALAVYG